MDIGQLAAEAEKAVGVGQLAAEANKLRTSGNWQPKLTSCRHRATGGQSPQAVDVGQMAAKADKLRT